MRVKVAVPIAQAVDELKEKVLASAETIEEQIAGETDWETVRSIAGREHWLLLIYSIQTLLIDPSQFKVLNELLHKEAGGKGRIETLVFANVASTSTT
jgi:ribosome maturation protein SDO1